MKKTLGRDIAILLVCSVGLGLLYNAFVPKPLPYIREALVPEYVSDEELFGSPADTPATTGERPPTDSLGGDTASTGQKNNMPDAQTAQAADRIEQVKREQAGSEREPGEQSVPARQQKVAEKQPETAIASKSSDIDNPEEGHGGVRDVLYDQILRLLKRSDVQFVDARKAEEFAQGKIGNAVNIYTPEHEEHMPEILSWPRENIYVVYCGGGQCELSHELAEIMLNFGFAKVFVYRGGFTEWKEKQGLE